MKKQLTLKLKTLHNGQKELLRKAKRYNHVQCGRRWGKTEFVNDLAIGALLDGKKVGIWYPNYKDMRAIWRKMEPMLSPFCKVHKSEHIISLKAGSIEFWSGDHPDSGRGRDYDLAIIDETAKIKDLDLLMTGTIMPTLIDRKGVFWNFSTPKKANKYYAELAVRAMDSDNWLFYKAPTNANPHLPASTMADMTAEMDDLMVQQELHAELVDFALKPFMYAFDKDKHVGQTDRQVNATHYVSFDFNVDPMTCVVAQHDNQSIRIIKEFKINNSNVFELLAQLKSWLGNSPVLVTGDAAGNSRNVALSGGRTNYHIIAQELHLSMSNQILVPKSNMGIDDSRSLCNAILNRWSVTVDPSCKYLIEDLLMVGVKDDGSIDKAKDSRQTHLLDAFRYYIHTWHKQRLHKQSY